jgi:tape measure domain-containing protein
MANIRQDQAQLIITIDAKESAAYQKVLQNTAKGVQDIKKLTAGTEEYNKVLNEQAEISRKLASSDYSKLGGKQLSDRRAQLIQLQRILPQVTFAEAGFERELRQVNTALATNAQRTRAVNSVMRSGSIGVKGFLAAFIGIGALQAFGVELFNQIKKINSLNAAYKLLIPETDKRARADAFLTRLANDYGLELTKLRDEYIKYNASAKASNLTLKDQELVFESVAKAGAVLGLSTETQGRAFTALQQIMSKGKVSAEELKGQLGDALPGAVTIMAKALGVGTGQLQKMLEAGEVMADDALPKFARELQKAYGVDQVKTIENLASAQNRAANSYTQLVTVIGDKVGPLFTRLFAGIANTTTALKEFISPTKTAAEQTKLLQNEFNSEIGVLKRLAPEAEGRKEIIDQLNIKYKDYLPNLIKESDSIDDITRAQKLANDAFQQKILLLVLEENLEKVKEKRLRAERLRSGAAVSRARTEQANEDLGNIGATPAQLEAQKNINKKFIDITVEGSKTLAKEATQEEEDYIKAAEERAIEFGSTLADIRKRFAPKDDGETRGSGGGSGAGQSAAEKKAEKDAAKLLKKKLELQQKEREALLAFNILDPRIAEGALDFRLKQLEESAAREQIFLEESYLEGKISLEQYELEKLRITSANLATRIELLDAYGQKESDKRRELNVALLQVESEIVKERAAQIGELENAQLSELESKFANRLITEEEYNLSRLRVQLNFYDEQLRLLEEAGLVETEVYKKIQDEKLKTQIDYNKQRTDNEARTKELQNSIASEGFGFLQETFKLGAELLSQDERRRKKYGEAIKKLSIAEVFINSLAEISKNYKNYGAIFGTIAAIATTVRAGISIAKINATQFYRGGKIKSVSGQLITEQPNINTLPGGDNVLIAAKKDEVVLNQQQQADAGGPEFFRRLGVPGFAGGGLVPSLPRTTPTINAQVLSRNGAPQADTRMDSILAAVDRITEAVSMVPEVIGSMNLKTHVVYTDLAKTQDTVAEIKRLSSY